MPSSNYSVIFLLAVMASSVSGSGYLRLELTASNDCVMKLSTSTLHSELLRLKMGTSRVLFINQLTQQEELKITFSAYGGPPLDDTFELRREGETHRNVISFGETVILVQSTFQCDEGFYGSRCLRIKKRFSKHLPAALRSSKKAATTTTTIIPTTNSIPTAIRSIQTNSSLASNFILYIILAVSILTLLLLILVYTFFHRLHKGISMELTISSDPKEMMKKDCSGLAV